MNGVPFHNTGFGRKFFNADVPRLVKALERIADGMEKQDEPTEASSERADSVVGDLTVEELYATLGNMISDGVDPETPVRLRTWPERSNRTWGVAAMHEPEDVWHSLEGRCVFIDEKGLL